MTKFIRYAFAAFFFAASVGCLALWWRSMTIWDMANGPTVFTSGRYVSLQSFAGTAKIELIPQLLTKLNRASFPPSWIHTSGVDMAAARAGFQPAWSEFGSFGLFDGMVYFPLWYPALVFALAGVVVLRFRRQFSIRSALIGLAVVAALLGMVVAL